MMADKTWEQEYEAMTPEMVQHEIGHIIHNPETTTECLLQTLKITTWGMNQTVEQLIARFNAHQAN